MIPGKVTGKFSIRLVPDMKPEDVERVTLEYINNLHAESGSPNKMRSGQRVFVGGGGGCRRELLL